MAMPGSPKDAVIYFSIESRESEGTLHKEAVNKKLPVVIVIENVTTFNSAH